MKVGILLIATGKYHVFADKLLTGLKKNFLPHIRKQIYLFADEYCSKEISKVCQRLNLLVNIHVISRKGFPGDTLYRYHYFLLEKEKILRQTDLVYYMDIDFDIRETIGEEIFPDTHHSLVATYHPGTFQTNGFPDVTGSPETRPESTSCIIKENRRQY